MNDHIGKPIKREDLLRKLGQWLPSGDTISSDHAGEIRYSFNQKSLNELRQLIGAEQVDQWLEQFDTQLKASFASDRATTIDRQQIARTAHAFIPQAALMGFSDFAELCTSLERTCLSGKEFTDLHERVCVSAHDICRQIASIGQPPPQSVFDRDLLTGTRRPISRIDANATPQVVVIPGSSAQGSESCVMPDIGVDGYRTGSSGDDPGSSGV
jgi:HPt (histidine-containing phosphotransfer) domain-containing protein